MGKLEQAQQVLEQAISANPDLPEAQNLLGLVLGQKGRLGRRGESLFAMQFPFSRTSRRRIIISRICWRGAAIWRKLNIIFRRQSQLNPAYTEAHHNYGLLLILMRSYDRAVAELRETIQLDPKLAQAYSDLADVLAAQGHIESAAAEYRQAIQLGPESYQAHLGLGQILARQGNAAEARSHYEKAAESPDPDIRGAALKALQ